MGGVASVVKVSVVNQTPYTWSFSIQDGGYTPIDPGRKISCDEAQANSRYIRVRYENHSCNSLSYEFNTHKGDTSFILRETEDRSQIQMLCTSDGGTRYCPNYGKIQEEQRRQEEEKRRLQQGKQRQREEEKKCRPR